MSATQSAEKFGQIFDLLANAARGKWPFNYETFAEEIWKLTSDIDFSPDEMDCDESLIALGLAKRTSPDRAEEGYPIVYRDEDEWRNT